MQTIADACTIPVKQPMVQVVSGADGRLTDDGPFVGTVSRLGL